MQTGTDESGAPIYTTVPVYTTQPVYTWQAIGSHLVTDTQQRSQDLWFAYDAMNRQVLADGALDGDINNLGNLTGGQGHLLNYDKNGNRIEDRAWGTQVTPQYTQNLDESGNTLGAPVLTGYTTETGIITHWYTYDSMNRLSTVATGAYAQVQTGTRQVQAGINESGQPVYTSVPIYTHQALGRGHAITLDTRRYDGASRVIESGPAGSLPAAYLRALVGGNTDLSGATTTLSRYDAAGRTMSQHVVNETNGSVADTVYAQFSSWSTAEQVQTGTDESGAPVYATVNVTHTAAGAGYDAAGNLLHYRTTQGSIATDYTVSLALYDGYKESAVAALATNSASGRQTGGTTASQYDVNGFLSGVTDSAQSANNRGFINDAAGRVLQKTQQGSVLHQLVIDGKAAGLYGVGVNPDTPGSQTLSAQANFDLAYRPVTNSYPSAATGPYPVRAGDTLESIAQGAYGDSSQWYRIAQANGLSGNPDLRVGQILTIPAPVGGVHNTADTFAPYDPARVVGSTRPELPMPQGNDDQGCGGIGTILMVVVAIVATIYTAGAAAGLLAGAESAAGGFAATMELGASVLTGGAGVAGTVATAAGVTATAGLEAAAIGGAAGSLASQAVGNLTGVQDGFSWQQVALSAIGTAVSAGVGGAAGRLGGTAGASGPADWAAAAGRGALGNALTQAAAVTVGAQNSFSWTAVAASAAGAGVGAAAGAGMNAALDYNAADGFDFGKSLVSGTAAGVAAGMTTKALQGGRVSALQVATDAFGNALGNSLAEMNWGGSQQTGVLYAADEQAQDFARENARFTRQAAAAQAATESPMVSGTGLNPFVSSEPGLRFQGLTAEDLRSQADEWTHASLKAKWNSENIVPSQAAGPTMREFDPAGKWQPNAMPLDQPQADASGWLKEAKAWANEKAQSAWDGIKKMDLDDYAILSPKNASAAAQYWADRHIQTGNALYAVPGALAAAWAENPDKVGMILSMGRGPSKPASGKPGEFSITDWTGYPAGVPKPEGPFRLVEGAEYATARDAANAANNAIRKQQNLVGQPVDIHEVQPVKFGGSPTDSANKVVLPRDVHRQQVTPWWNKLQRDITGQ